MSTIEHRKSLSQPKVYDLTDPRNHILAPIHVLVRDTFFDSEDRIVFPAHPDEELAIAKKLIADARQRGIHVKLSDLGFPPGMCLDAAPPTLELPLPTQRAIGSGALVLDMVQ